MTELLNRLFANLDTWRNFPAYQLERRADVFFSVYLPEYLKEVRGYQIQAIIPEFPLSIGTLYSNRTNKSFKVDYLIKTQAPSRAIFVELKTDPGSIRPPQIKYLNDAKESGMETLLRGLIKIYSASISKPKYRFLLRELVASGFINPTGEDDYEVPSDQPKISILYVLPKQQDLGDVITFSELSKFVGKKPDDLSKRFSESLEKWMTEPGSANGT